MDNFPINAPKLIKTDPVKKSIFVRVSKFISIFSHLIILLLGSFILKSLEYLKVLSHK